MISQKSWPWPCTRDWHKSIPVQWQLLKGTHHWVNMGDNSFSLFGSHTHSPLAIKGGRHTLSSPLPQMHVGSRYSARSAPRGVTHGNLAAKSYERKLTQPLTQLQTVPQQKYLLKSRPGPKCAYKQHKEGEENPPPSPAEWV